ncbi:MAG TPA: SDR family oxidoreductase [Candidatus Margulisiibacteriota bacterium]|nr:SDR family oxidoreductase [Candidatus Margulisiibacteriota bacterium]
MVLEGILPLVGSFRDQVVLVTGASSGIGRETALTFAGRGAAVALAARRRAQLEEVAAAVTDAGGRALVLPTDVTDARAARASVAKVRRKWGRIDILVNNAGVLLPAPIEQLSAADFEAMLRVNVFGALFMMQAVLPVMREHKRGTIINVASLAGRRGITPLGGYCATKFALVALTEALRTEVDTSQIHVGLVMPGVVDTPMAQGFNQQVELPAWPTALNMPPEWVVAAILLGTRFRLREVSVPPGAATVELLGALAPALTDTLIRWTSAAASYLAGAAATAAKPAAKNARRRQTAP